MSNELKVYEYSKCSTCRSAVKSLKEKGHNLKLIPIMDAPPSKEELKELLHISGFPLKRFFNTAGEAYRELGLKDKLATMSEEEQLALLASNGRLIKRPIVFDGNKVTIGYKEDEYEKEWGQ